MIKIKYVLFVFAWVCLVNYANAQFSKITWTPDGNGYFKFKDGGIVKVDPRTDNETLWISAEQLTPAGFTKNLKVQSFDISNDNQKILLFANTAKVWRYNTRGDYWVLNLQGNKLVQLGKGLPAQSLMFAKFSPDGKLVAYVSGHNIYIEDLAGQIVRKMTMDGTTKMINGTFDWVYEEEFGCRDGFRWSPDSRSIAFWQVDATQTKDYYMLNTTDSNYSRPIPVECPKVGEKPSPAKIGVLAANGGVIKWMKIDGDPSEHYLTRMEWNGNNQLVIQQLDRKQQESRLIYANPDDGNSYTFWAENDNAWVDMNTDNPMGWNWINKGQDFLWISEKDGWRHIYKISRDGKDISLLTKGSYDIQDLLAIDEANNYVYFSASPANATQLYLYRVKINNPKENPELVSSARLEGMHDYAISPNAHIARHRFSNHNTAPVTEFISLPDGKPLNSTNNIAKKLKVNPDINVEYLQVTTDDNIVLDAWINKPRDFDATKKYPVVFYVYGEPAASVVNDSYGAHFNFLYAGDMSRDGYIQVGIDNRGTPSLKGAGWRKSIYKKIGVINIRDMALGAKKILEKPYMDKERVAVWGWSGGGSSTLNLLFNYPEIFQTGIAIAAVTNQLFYDNIYQERYMGLPQENKQDFINGSPISHVQGLKGKLLYIHGTGDDNVHYSNAELLLNELIKYNKQFEFMAYPNRTHNISEGPGTFLHLQTLYSNFLRKNCPPGAR